MDNARRRDQRKKYASRKEKTRGTTGGSYERVLTRAPCIKKDETRDRKNIVRPQHMRDRTTNTDGRSRWKPRPQIRTERNKR